MNLYNDMPFIIYYGRTMRTPQTIPSDLIVVFIGTLDILILCSYPNQWEYMKFLPYNLPETLHA